MSIHSSGAPLFPGIRFAHAISLGGDCETAHGLRGAGRHSVNGVFDWLVTPLDAIGAVLADDGMRLGADCSIVHEGTSVRCGGYGMLLHHEFPRDADRQVRLTEDAAAICRSKLAHKMASLLHACGQGPVLFIRCGLETDLPWDRFGADKEQPGARELDGLAATLARRFPRLEFRLLGVVAGTGLPADFGTLHDPRIAAVALPCEGTGGWKITGEAWSGLLSRVEFEAAASGSFPRLDERLFWFEGDEGLADSGLPGIPGGGAEAVPNRAAFDAALERDDVATAIPALSALVGGDFEPPDLAWRTGLDLWNAGRPAQAVEAFRIAFGHGFRHLPFLQDYLGLLAGETRYAEVVEALSVLRAEEGPANPRFDRHLTMMAGQARLAMAHPREPEIALAAARAASAAWLDAPALLEAIAAAIRERRPFSFIRVGDGEARYLIAASHGAGSPISAEEADAMGDVCWDNWFGEPWVRAGDAPRTSLLAAYGQAVRSADVIGACTPERLRQDTAHYGYLAWQENWLRRTLAGRADIRWTDAHAHRRLNALTPFLRGLLECQDVLGVISPHPGLAEALKRHLRIGTVVGHVVPAEGRLPTAGETRALGAHFPAIYEKLLASLTVPRPGCVFLVAAGLLGKIYCARIKQLGGIALDIGALADAWMGFDTRDGQLAEAGSLPPAPVSQSEGAGHPTTYACVSIGKTGSMALAGAIRDAGIPDAVHLHWLGPRALKLKSVSPEPMLTLAQDVARRIEEPGHRFRIVTAVRDPIALILSKAFYSAERVREAKGIDIVRDREALVAWWIGEGRAGFDWWTAWFDDSFRTTFGFDFRDHPFDTERRSLRYASERLRLLALRQEDDRAGRERELGWLLDREGVELRTVNDAAGQGYEPAYRSFLRDFAAPSEWLDTCYDSEVIRHFYTEAERDAFRARWRANRSRPASAAATGAQPDTVACLSITKTGSTALVAALRDAYPDRNVAHLHWLGPLARQHDIGAGAPSEEILGNLDNPAASFAIVTSVRDPIARFISDAFHNEVAVRAATGKSFTHSAAAFIEWVEALKMKHFYDIWFDDSLKTPFGFDFRDHPFDFERRSLRFSSERLRLLVLRQEDPAFFKETELGWLTGRARGALPVENAGLSRPYGERYKAFLDAFAAPASWLELFYETDVARHFYTPAERDAFRDRWRAPRKPSVAGLTLAAPGPASEQAVAQEAPGASPPGEAERELEALRRRMREGRAVDFQDYSYRPRERDWTASRGAAKLRARFEAERETYADLLQRFCAFDGRFREIPVLADGTRPCWENPWLPGLDAVALYGLAAATAPRTYLEIGSGHSTRFVRQAIRDNGLPTRIVSIDPSPTAEIDALCDEVVRGVCEDVPLSVFAGLRAGDMLFFDGSHRSFQNSDSTVFFTEILPALAPGVVYGIHDIFLPFDYPESWTNRFYNEQYLLMAYLLGGAGGDEIVFPTHHVSCHEAFAPLRNRLFLGTRHLDWLASSFWMRRAATL